MSADRTFATMRPYRVVYGEVCEPLHHVTSLATVLKTMMNCLTAVQLMYCIGWIHRDVSAGNLLWYGAGERGILSDLEYAKEFIPHGSGHPDPKTGTVSFMAVEIASELHIFVPQRGFRRKADSIRVHHVIHNFQHDLESFFWLLLWTLLDRIEGTPTSQWLVKTVFMENDLIVRRKVLTDTGYLGEMLSKALPNCLAPYREELEWFSGALFTGYMLRESKIEDIASYAQPLCIGSAILAECHDCAVGADVVLKVYGKAEARLDGSASQPARRTMTARKRDRDEDAHDPDKSSGGTGCDSEEPLSKSRRGESTTDVGAERQLRPRTESTCSIP
ncbi:hypothetical protein OE88DRAFT_1096107 [Heliocybe sulcata]|uniref:Fungal-type protein kinase domain-containing protein n=1 Tax=Heliocybe sulcata TaxID=5364 RepID=A0A5C3MK28_9AGAM|nr:hypothetical protein OE88DRAFT_1096107 [Heliocybe sulcata]